MTQANEVFDGALGLPSDIRADLAYQLLVSLDPPDLTVDVSSEWAAEIQRRRERYLRGESKSFSAAETIQRIRQRLDEMSGTDQ